MKRIQTACLNQTIHFQLKPDTPPSVAVVNVQDEYESYRKELERNGIKYIITDEQPQDDGSIIIKIKRQINDYDVGDYLIKQ